MLSLVTTYTFDKETATVVRVFYVVDLKTKQRWFTTKDESEAFIYVTTYNAKAHTG